MKRSTVFDLEVSRIGIGTVQFGFDYGINNKVGQVSFDQILEIFQRARQEGVNFLDTSRAYGQSEESIGRALAELDAHDDFVICTKLDMPPGYQHLSDRQVVEAARTALYTSLEKLGLSSIPIYLLHQWEYRTFRDGILWEFVQEERDKGTLRYPGISIGGGPSEALDAVQDPSVEVLQIPFNVLDSRWHDSGVLERARSQGIAVFNRSAYLQGLTLMEPSEVERRLSFAVPYIRRLRSVAAELQMDLRALVLGYATTEPEFFSTVLGVDSIQQFEENVELYRAYESQRQRSTYNGEKLVALGPELRKRFSDVPEHVVDPSLWGRTYEGNAGNN